jgi:hypothetical protein
MLMVMSYLAGVAGVAVADPRTAAKSNGVKPSVERVTRPDIAAAATWNFESVIVYAVLTFAAFV